MTLVLLVVVASIVSIFALHHAFSGPRGPTAALSEPEQIPTAAGPMTMQDTPAHPVLTFDDGTRFQLLGVREHGTAGPWWGADGAAVSPPPKLAARRATSAATRPGRRILEVHFNAVARTGRSREFRFIFPGQRGLVMGDDVVLASVPAEQTAGDVQIGLRAGAWVQQLRADVSLDRTNTTNPAVTVTTRPTTAPAAPHVGFGQMKYENGRLKVELIDHRTDAERMQSVYGVVVLLAPDDRERLQSGARSAQDRVVYEFSVPREQVRAVAFVTRRVDWKTLANLSYRLAATQPTTAP